MPDDTITLISTTDSAEQVQAALVGKPAAKTAEAAPDTPATPEAKPDTPDAPATPVEAEIPANETAEQKEAREASDAGTKLAKRRKKIEDEIGALWGKKHEVRRDVEAEQARLNELRQQREDLERTGKTPDTPATPAAPAAAAGDKPAAGRPEPKLDAVDAKGDAKYATYEDYLSDHAVWTREEAILAARSLIEQERTTERERIERDSATRAVNERLATYNTNLEAFKKTHADFDAAFEDARDAVQDTLVAIGPQALKVIDGYTVFDAEDGPALTYYLLKRPDELKAIALKAPQQQVVHLARLEERIRQGGAPKKARPVISDSPETKAPEPIRPVGSGPTATTVSSDEESYQDYRARRERELRHKRGA